MAHLKELKKEAVEEHFRSRNDRPSEEDRKKPTFSQSHTDRQTHTYVLTDYLGQ